MWMCAINKILLIVSRLTTLRKLIWKMCNYNRKQQRQLHQQFFPIYIMHWTRAPSSIDEHFNFSFRFQHYYFQFIWFFSFKMKTAEWRHRRHQRRRRRHQQQCGSALYILCTRNSYKWKWPCGGNRHIFIWLQDAFTNLWSLWHVKCWIHLPYARCTHSGGTLALNIFYFIFSSFLRWRSVSA